MTCLALEFCRAIISDGWGLLASVSRISARFMAADSHHSIVHARRISGRPRMILRFGGRGGGGLLLALRTLTITPRWPGR